MKHLILDSNILHQHSGLFDQPLLLLKRLVEAGCLKVLVPYVVEKEFVTKRTAKYEKHISALECAVGSLLKLPLPQPLLQQLTTLKGGIEDCKAPLLSISADRFSDWLQLLSAERLDLCQTQAVKALDAYFHGTPPFKIAKAREHIPDSFIFHSVLKTSLERGKVVFITSDNGLFDAVRQLPNVQVFKKLQEFTESSEIQSLIASLDAVEDIFTERRVMAFYESIPENSNANLLFTDAVKSEVGDKILWEKIGDLDDAEDVTITSYGVVGSPDFLWPELSYYGDGNFTLPFSVTVDTEITYYILKSTWCSLDESEAPSVTDHNDHYFEARGEMQVCVEGVLSFSLFADASPGEDEIVDDTSLKIDSITLITTA